MQNMQKGPEQTFDEDFMNDVITCLYFTLVSPADEIGRRILFWRCPSVRTDFVSALFLENYWLDFKETLCETLIKGDACHRPVPVQPFNSELWSLITYALSV